MPALQTIDQPRRSTYAIRHIKAGPLATDRSLNVGPLAAALTILALLVLVRPAAGQAVIAHRGDSSNAPGNTLSAVRSALGSADLVEMDVQITRDRKLVLMHDFRVNDTTNGIGFVLLKTFDTIRAFDAGGWFSPSFTGEQIPLLREAIQLTLSGGKIPLVEHKIGLPIFYDREFREMGLPKDSFRLMSFQRRFVRRMNAIDSGYDLGVLGFGRLTPRKLLRLKRKGADFVSWYHRRIRTCSTVDLVHSFDMDLYTWTVNEPSDMRRLINLRVDGITTDKPGTLRRQPGLRAMRMVRRLATRNQRRRGLLRRRR